MKELIELYKEYIKKVEEYVEINHCYTYKEPLLESWSSFITWVSTGKIIVK